MLPENLHLILNEACLAAASAADRAHAVRRAFEQADADARRAEASAQGAYVALMKAAKLNPDAYRPRWDAEAGEVHIEPLAAPEETPPDGSS